MFYIRYMIALIQCLVQLLNVIMPRNKRQHFINNKQNVVKSLLKLVTELKNKK